jgi:hypothetical protein
VARKNKRWVIKNLEAYREIIRKSANKRRMQVLEHYSKGKFECACCGDKHIEFLAIDHINGGGGKHRVSLGEGGQYIISWIRNNNYPEGFRVLCHNCNSSLGHYGYCPHELYEHEKN